MLNKLFKRSKENTQDLTHPESMKEKVGDNTIEEGVPNNSHRTNKNMTKLGLLGGGFVGMGLLVAGLLFLNGGDKEEKTDLPKPNIANRQTKNFNNEKVDIDDERKKIEEASKVTEPPKVAPTPKEAPPPVSKVEKKEEPDRRLLGNVLVYGGNNSDTSNTNHTAQANAQPVSNNGDIRGNNLQNMLNRTVTLSTKAVRRPDLTYLLPKGTGIACTLETKIITTLPGLTRCRVTKDIYSANGKVLLIERGSMVIGEQTSALLQGQARVFVLWTDVETPNGVRIAIDSPAAGRLGAAGQGADVDTHFWQRFGGAIMLSLIGDFSNALSKRIEGKSKDSNTNITFEETQDAAQKMAEIALQNSINIPPTGYVNQGSLLNIMVARDVDFSHVYEVINPYTYDMY